MTYVAILAAPKKTATEEQLRQMKTLEKRLFGVWKTYSYSENYGIILKRVFLSINLTCDSGKNILQGTVHFHRCRVHGKLSCETKRKIQ